MYHVDSHDLTVVGQGCGGERGIMKKSRARLTIHDRAAGSGTPTRAGGGAAVSSGKKGDPLHALSESLFRSHARERATAVIRFSLLGCLA